jgi:hypothetical protein
MANQICRSKLKSGATKYQAFEHLVYADVRVIYGNNV